VSVAPEPAAIIGHLSASGLADSSGMLCRWDFQRGRSSTIAGVRPAEGRVKVAVLFGGDSMERDVSVASASQVIGALRGRGHEVIAVDSRRGAVPSEQERELFSGGIDRLPPEPASARGLPAFVTAPELGSVDVVFVALHGGSGEDGTVQALLDLLGVPYTGTGKLGTALGWDKDIAKRLFVAAGVPTPAWLIAPASGEAVAERLGYPLIVKPNGQGSTVGLTLVNSPEELEAAIDLARRFDAEVMLERYIAGRELTVGILDGAPLAVGEIIPSSGPIFDYAAKYQKGAAEEIFPADLSPERTAAVQALALAAHRALKLASYSRVDFRMDAEGGFWCLEVNTLPGMSAGSLLPQSAAVAGVSFAELCERICAGALDR
jgi:D-alanine-D-alanine ligase